MRTSLEYHGVIAHRRRHSIITGPCAKSHRAAHVIMSFLILRRSTAAQSGLCYFPGTRVQITTVPHGSTVPLPRGVNCEGTVAKLS